MKALRIIGIILILLGLVMISTGGFSFNQKKKVIDIGTVHINRTETKTVTWPWFAGAAAMIGGIAILLVSRNKP